MALNIKNERVHELAREAARRTGTTQTSALEMALEQYLGTLEAQDAMSGSEARLARARDIVDRMRASFSDADREAMRADIEQMYDEHGLPA